MCWVVLVFAARLLERCWKVLESAGKLWKALESAFVFGAQRSGPIFCTTLHSGFRGGFCIHVWRPTFWANLWRKVSFWLSGRPLSIFLRNHSLSPLIFGEGFTVRFCLVLPLISWPFSALIQLYLSTIYLLHLLFKMPLDSWRFEAFSCPFNFVLCSVHFSPKP